MYELERKMIVEYFIRESFLLNLKNMPVKKTGVLECF
jgi:hypothetical protein